MYADFKREADPRRVAIARIIEKYVRCWDMEEETADPQFDDCLNWGDVSSYIAGKIIEAAQQVQSQPL